MKFPSFVATFAAAAVFFVGASAQTVAIGAPPDQTSVSPGQSLTVEIDKPDTLSGSDDVAVVIALRSCASLPGGSCSTFDVSQALGTILFQGPYTPTFQNVPGQGFKPPYENFTVTIPATIPTGQAALSVTHFVLIGAGPFASIDTHNVTLNVV